MPGARGFLQGALRQTIWNVTMVGLAGAGHDPCFLLAPCQGKADQTACFFCSYLLPQGGVRRPCVGCLLGQALRCDNPQVAALGSPAGKREATAVPHSHDLVSLRDVSSHDRYFSPEVRSHLSVTKGQRLSLYSLSEMPWLELSRANCFLLFCQNTTGVLRYARRSCGHVL